MPDYQDRYNNSGGGNDAVDDEQLAYARLRQLARTATITQLALQAPQIATQDVVDQVDYNSGGGSTTTAPRDVYFGKSDGDGGGGGMTAPFTGNPNRAMEALNELPPPPFVPMVQATRPRSNAFSMNVATTHSPLAGNYRHEAQDPNHRMVLVVQKIATILGYSYMENPENDRALYNWLQAQSYNEMGALLEQVGGKSYRHEHILHFMRGVAYLAESQRKNYKVKVKEGKLMWKGRVLDTADLDTNFSGMGFAIWVLSPPIGRKRVNKLYTNSHRYGSFHHSSFLSGDDVVAAGEWKVTAGVIKSISSKTGHYRCTPTQLQVAMRVIQGWGVDVSGATVRLYDNTAKPTEIPAPEFLIADPQKMGWAAFGKGDFPGIVARPGIGSHRRTV